MGAQKRRKKGKPSGTIPLNPFYMRAAGCGLRAAGCGLRAAGCGLRANMRRGGVWRLRVDGGRQVSLLVPAATCLRRNIAKAVTFATGCKPNAVQLACFLPLWERLQPRMPIHAAGDIQRQHASQQRVAHDHQQNPNACHGELPLQWRRGICPPHPHKPDQNHCKTHGYGGHPPCAGSCSCKHLAARSKKGIPEPFPTKWRHKNPCQESRHSRTNGHGQPHADGIAC